MARSPLHSGLARWSLPLSITALLMLGLAPLRYIEWVDWFSGPAAFVVAPASGPVTALARRLVPARRDQPAVESVRELEAELDRTRLLYHQVREENERLRRLNEELQRGSALNPSVRIRQIARPVVGASSDLASGALRVRAGRGDGVTRNTVATVGGTQLLGRVVSVEERTSRVALMNAGGGPRLTGSVILDPEGLRTLRCLLEPVGDGTLRGQVEDPRGGDPLERDGDGLGLRIGQTVRLRDDAWPRNAQMLVIGTVERIGTAPDQPLRPTIVVRPTVALRAVGEVVLRIPRDDEPGGGG